MTMCAASLPLTTLASPFHPLSFPCFKSFPFSIRTPNHQKLSTFFNTKRLVSDADFSSSAPTSLTLQEAAAEEEESYQILSAMKSDYNDIIIVDTPKSRMLLLDSTHNVHSILYKEQKWTGSYWDEFASLPAIVPKGPIAILGLGGGTAAHLMLHLWPSLQLEGWEIDEILIDKARDYFGLSDLEKTTEGGGVLNVHIGDVFIPSENLCRRYAGIVVDLFSEGKVLPQLEEVSTWLELQERLMPGGRFMVNCGGIDGDSSPESLLSVETWLLNPTLKALSKAFPGQLSWKRMPKVSGENFMALTGPMPDVESWSASVASPLSTNVKDWRPCGQISRI